MRLRLLLLTALWAMWLIPTAVLAERVAADAFWYETGKSGPGINTSCPIASDDSDYGSARWQWWPTGEVCLDHQGRRTRWPQPWRSEVLIAAAIGFVILPWLTVATARAERRSHAAAAGSDARLDELTWLSE